MSLELQMGCTLGIFTHKDKSVSETLARDGSVSDLYFQLNNSSDSRQIDGLYLSLLWSC